MSAHVGESVIFTYSWYKYKFAMFLESTLETWNKILPIHIDTEISLVGIYP